MGGKNTLLQSHSAFIPIARHRGSRQVVSESELSSLNPTVMAKGDDCHPYDVDEKTVIQDCIYRRSAAG